MNKTKLVRGYVVSNENNLKLNFTKNGALFYKGRTFSKVRHNGYNEKSMTSYMNYLYIFFQENYCLDYEIEFCDKEQKIPKDMKLRAVIHDDDLYNQVRIF